jgi:hypothetical protein
MSRFALLRASLRYLTHEWLADDECTATAREVRRCRAAQMRCESFDGFEVQVISESSLVLFGNSVWRVEG